MKVSPRARGIAMLLALSAAGCASPERESQADPAEAPAPPPSLQQQAAGQGETFQLSVADLDAYERGLRAELAAVREAERQKRQASTTKDTLAALAASAEVLTMNDGARAVGMHVDRYRQMRRTVESLLRGRRVSAAAAAPPPVDTSGMPPELRARVRENLAQLQQAGSASDRTADGLAPEVAAALNERAPRLDTLFTQLIEARLSAAR